MKILRKTEDLHIDLNFDTDFQTNAGWEENMQQFEDEVLYDIVNPIDNYETIRYIHKPYSGITDFSGDTQCDIWFYFYFLNPNTNDYTNGLDYSNIGLDPKENAKLLKATSESFFRLEFYKTPLKNGEYEAPNRYNRRLVFAKNLSLPLGEKIFYSPIRKNIHVPVFMGSNYRNKENMYLFWFKDESVLEETNLSGKTATTNTFFMTAKFFNKIDGSIVDFTNNDFESVRQINDVSDMYYQVDIDKTDYSYRIHKFNGTVSEYSDRIGVVTGNTINGNVGVSPVRFYERKTIVTINATQTPTPTITPTISLTPTNTPTPTPTPVSGGGGGGGPVVTRTYYKLRPCEYQGQVGYIEGDYDVWSTGYLSSVFSSGDRVEGSLNYFYVVVGSSTTDPGTYYTVYDTGDTGCPEPTLPSVPLYSLITLVRPNTNNWFNLNGAKTQLCGNHPTAAFDMVGGGRIFTKYITYEENGLQPETIYTVYNTENRTPGDEFNGENIKYGVMIGGNTITHIVNVSPNGELSDWESCL
jgi:hypothetical protein